MLLVIIGYCIMTVLSFTSYSCDRRLHMFKYIGAINRMLHINMQREKSDQTHTQSEGKASMNRGKGDILYILGEYLS